jgi:RNA ligase (TIGR02306 family)
MSSDDTYAGLQPCPTINSIEGKDRIGYVNIGGYPLIIRKDSFKEGDLGLFIYVDSILPPEMVEHYELTRLKNGRVKAMKMAGITSQGLFLPLTYNKIPKDAAPYVNIAKDLGIGHWKPEQKLYKGQAPGIKARNWPVWLDVMHISRLTRPDYLDTFKPSDWVVITEKIHGMNATYAKTLAYTDPVTGKFTDEEISVMSRQVRFTRDRAVLGSDQLQEQTNAFYKVFDDNLLEKKLKDWPTDIVIRGEVFGKKIQDLEYGLQDLDFRVFDIQLERGKYLGWDEMCKVCWQLGLKPVPLLYYGPYNFEKAKEFAEQDSHLCLGQMSEGVVVRPKFEEKLPTGERKILKIISSRYAARDDSKEVAE